MSETDISPASLPFNRYLADSAPTHMHGPAQRALHYVAMAKRMLLQERCRDFTAADVVALAGLIERTSTGRE